MLKLQDLDFLVSGLLGPLISQIPHISHPITYSNPGRYPIPDISRSPTSMQIKTSPQFWNANPNSPSHPDSTISRSQVLNEADQDFSSILSSLDNLLRSWRFSNVRRFCIVHPLHSFLLSLVLVSCSCHMTVDHSLSFTSCLSCFSESLYC